LTWTHYKCLMRVENEKAREWYMNEAANQSWSTRQLDRQISVFYYERILGSRDKESVRREAVEKMPAGGISFSPGRLNKNCSNTQS
jgi:predicted nuclease of restriction endonuclease-like (RecB) superfamily